MMYIFFTGLTLCIVVAPRSGLLDNAVNAVPESDDDKLNQALILVDILKSEYLKLLRERSASATTTTGADIVEQPTCAATTRTTTHSTPPETSNSTLEQNNKTPVSRPSIRSPGPVYPWGWPMHITTVVSNRFCDVKPQPAEPQYPNLFPLSRRHFRRNFPDYAYYYGPYRRSDYYDENREEIATGHYRRKDYYENRLAANDGPERIVTIKSEKATSQTHSKKKTATRIDFDNNHRRFYTPWRRSNKQITTNSNATTTTNSTTKGAKASTIAKPTISTANNTNGAGTIGNGTRTTAVIFSSSRKLIHTFKTKVTHASTELWPAFRYKTTLRIFLENSTPLPIPFPENNAFCFTNPNNALCRSP